MRPRQPLHVQGVAPLIGGVTRMCFPQGRRRRRPLLKPRFGVLGDLHTELPRGLVMCAHRREALLLGVKRLHEVRQPRELLLQARRPGLLL